METIYLAGGCLWGVQYFLNTLPGVIKTEAGRANGQMQDLNSPYDGYAECVKTNFNPKKIKLTQLLTYFFEIIDPYSLDTQGMDIGHKYRTGIYSKDPNHLIEAKAFIQKQPKAAKIQVEVLPLTNYIPSSPEHQDHLERFPQDHYLCSIPWDLLDKYKET